MARVPGAGRHKHVTIAIFEQTLTGRKDRRPIDSLDAVAVDVITFDYDVAEVDADAELNSLCRGDALALAGHFPLDPAAH